MTRSIAAMPNMKNRDYRAIVLVLATMDRVGVSNLKA
jgi:hypothetical protein